MEKMGIIIEAAIVSQGYSEGDRDSLPEPVGAAPPVGSGGDRHGSVFRTYMGFPLRCFAPGIALRIREVKVPTGSPIAIC